MKAMKENGVGPHVVLRGNPQAKRMPVSPPIITVRQNNKQAVKVTSGGLKRPMEINRRCLGQDLTNRWRPQQRDDCFNESPVPEEDRVATTTIFFQDARSPGMTFQTINEYQDTQVCSENEDECRGNSLFSTMPSKALLTSRTVRDSLPPQ